MARTPRADETIFESTVDPTVNDDDTQAFDVGSRWINTTTGVVFFCVDNSTAAAVWKRVSTDFIVSAEETVALVTTAQFPTFAEFLTVTTPTLLAGDYEITWFYMWSHNSTSTDFIARVQVDNTTDLIDPGDTGIHRQEPKDAAGTGTGGTNQRYPASGRRIVTLTAGTHDIDIDVATQTSGNESTMYHAVITVRSVN